MSFTNGQHSWSTPSGSLPNGIKNMQQFDDGPARNQTPIDNPITLAPEASDLEEEARRAHFSEIYRKTDSKLALLFTEDGNYNSDAIQTWTRAPASSMSSLLPDATDHTPIQEPPRKKAKRTIDEDDYDDDEDDEDDDSEENTAAGVHTSPLKHKITSDNRQLLSPSKSGSSPVHSVSSPDKHSAKAKEDGSSQGHAKTAEDARKELQQARIATEEAAKRSFHTIIYPLENDRTAMLEQQQLEESEKQLQAEMEKNSGGNATQGPDPNQGTLSSANLGASSLTLKHLIARIDQKRIQVKASDAELRSLMNEVRKNRSKWASEENVGQEELYEAAEKVLSELKAHTEYSTPFLSRVNKRDAPDYYNLIKHPMDLGSMTKKLKQLQYKSKADFVVDLNLIWDNCLRYNQDSNHHLRRMANGMRKEAEKLIPLIPDIVVRPRAEVEAEERRKQNGGEDDAGDDSDDEPIMSSRGRIAGSKGTNKSRKAPSDQQEQASSSDTKPTLQLNGLLAKGREGSEAIDGSTGFGTPPIGGANTPIGMNGQSGQVSNVDSMDVDGPSINGMTFGEALEEVSAPVYEDEEYKIWKQVTKKQRATIARQRHKLFEGNKLNPDEPALLRTKAGMRRYLHSQQQAEMSGLLDPTQADGSSGFEVKQAKAPETLAEGMQDEEEKIIPDYYEPQTIIPDIPSKLRWVQDGEGFAIDQFEEFHRLVPQGHFTAPQSRLSKRLQDNMRQMQETRKLCSKIGVIKQMQIQTQIYQNQFPKYNPEPFVEADIEPHFTSGDGAVVAPETCRAAMQRSVAEICYHAGFEEFQPSALDAITDIAADYMQKLVRTFNVYNEADKKPARGSSAEAGHRWQPRFTPEEVVLHTLAGNGYDPESLESYTRDDVDRLGGKLVTIHERMKAHLSDLLRPALNDAGPDGAGAFKEGSEQFVSGDFAEDLGEDFFGFKSLGLDKELGLDFLSVPLHLLQRRVYANAQSQTQVAGVAEVDLLDPLPTLEPVTKENIQEQIGLVKNFFLAKLHANGDSPLIEDEELPVKQRRPRPRLGATGKIVSPQKRPPKEQIALAKKKKKLESGMAQVTAGKNAADPASASAAVNGVNSTPEKAKKLKAGLTNPALVLAPTMERVDSMQSMGNNSHTDKDEGVDMMSPENS